MPAGGTEGAAPCPRSPGTIGIVQGPPPAARPAMTSCLAARYPVIRPHGPPLPVAAKSRRRLSVGTCGRQHAPRAHSGAPPFPSAGLGDFPAFSTGLQGLIMRSRISLPYEMPHKTCRMERDLMPIREEWDGGGDDLGQRPWEVAHSWVRFSGHSVPPDEPARRGHYMRSSGDGTREPA